MTVNIAAIICAAGSSSRFNSGSIGGRKKEYMNLGSCTDDSGKPLTVLGASVLAFAAFPCISPIVITVPAGEEDKAAASLTDHLLGRGNLFFCPGGKTRRESVHNALLFLKDHGADYVLIHDGARPWVSGDLIGRVIEAMMLRRAVVPLVQAADTPKQIEGGNFFGSEPAPAGFIGRPCRVAKHLRRTEIGFAQTPQGFAFPEILEAHEKAAVREKEEGFIFTDDAEVWAEFIGPVAAVMGEAENRKITFPEDLRQ